MLSSSQSTYSAAVLSGLPTTSVVPQLTQQTNYPKNDIAPGLNVYPQQIIEPNTNTNPLVLPVFSSRPWEYPPKNVRNNTIARNGSLPSLCLPRVPLTFNPAVLRNTPLGEYGNIKLLDFSLKFDEFNAPYFMCFIHFNSWSTEPKAVQELQNICNPRVRVFYPYDIGSVVENTSVDRYLTLSGYDSYHTAEIDECFETFWDTFEKPHIEDMHWWEILQDESVQSELLNEQQTFEELCEYTEADHSIATSTSKTLNWSALCMDTAKFDKSIVKNNV
jgi:hypothetical protein